MELGRAAIIFFILMLLVLGSLPTVAAPNAKKASVLLAEAKSQSLADSLSFPGQVRSRVNATMTSEIEGQVLRLEKVLGSKVKKGDVILVLQNTDPVYRYAPLKVRSSSDGYLTQLEVNLMQKVERGQKLFTVTDPANLMIQVEVPAHDLASLAVGQRGVFKVRINSTESIPVVIEGLSPLIDVRSGTATAELKPLSKAETLRQGQLGQIQLQTNERQSFLLPESAIVNRDDKTFVRVLEAGKIQKKPIELGNRIGDSFEVKSGVKSGDQIVTRTSRFVADGEDVEVQKEQSKEN